MRAAATSSTTLAPSTPTRREGRCSVAERAGGARRVCGEVRRRCCVVVLSLWCCWSRLRVCFVPVSRVLYVRSRPGRIGLGQL